MKPKPLYVGHPNAAHRMILLCGIHETLHGFEEICRYWQQQLPHFEFILPAAPVREVSQFGYVTPAWFDIPQKLPESRLDLEADGLSETAAAIAEYIKDPSRTVLAGFSQGAAAALYTGLTLPKGNLGGIVALSGYLPAATKLLQIRGDANMEQVTTKLLLAHGTVDTTVASVNADMTEQFIIEHGLVREPGEVYLQKFTKTGHEVRLQQVDFVRDWVKARFEI